MVDNRPPQPDPNDPRIRYSLGFELMDGWTLAGAPPQVREQVQQMQQALEAGNPEPLARHVTSMIIRNVEFLSGRYPDDSGTDRYALIFDLLNVLKQLSPQIGEKPTASGSSPEAINPEKKEVSGIKAMLEIAEAALKQGYISSHDTAVYLQESVKQASDKGYDLSSVPDLDARLQRLLDESPRVVVESCIRNAERASEGSDRFLTLSWYWKAKEEFERYQVGIPSDEIERFSERLQAIASKLGIE